MYKFNRKPSILIIDDELEWIDPHAIALELEGYNVTKERDALVALEKIKKGMQFDAIILDLLMPPIRDDVNEDYDFTQTGVEVLREIRKYDIHVPVVVVSVVIADEIRKKIKDIDENKANFLQKPVMPEDLVSMVEKLVEPKK